MSIKYCVDACGVDMCVCVRERENTSNKSLVVPVCHRLSEPQVPVDSERSELSIYQGTGLHSLAMSDI